MLVSLGKMGKEDFVDEIPEERDLDADLRIDEMSLNKEWRKQPKTYHAWSKIAARAKRMAEIRKGDLEVVKSEVSQDIRNHPSSHGISKVTDKAIETAVILDVRYKKALRQSIDARYDSDVLSGAVKAMEQRKDSLEWLSKLFLANYYSEPEHTMESREAMNELDEKDVKKKILLSLNKRRGG